MGLHREQPRVCLAFHPPPSGCGGQKREKPVGSRWRAFSSPAPAGRIGLPDFRSICFQRPAPGLGSVPSPASGLGFLLNSEQAGLPCKKPPYPLAISKGGRRAVVGFLLRSSRPPAARLATVTELCDSRRYGPSFAESCARSPERPVLRRSCHLLRLLPGLHRLRRTW